MNEENIKVLVPSGLFESRSGWLCYVCLRGPCREARPWSWFGCEHCRSMDRRVGALFGARRFLTLGQHSIMNDLGLKVDGASDAQLSAFADQLQAMVGGWKVLGDWSLEKCCEMAEPLDVELIDGHGEVPLEEWQAAYPWKPEASATAYLEHLTAHQSWVLELDPRIRDIEWLTASDD